MLEEATLEEAMLEAGAASLEAGADTLEAGAASLEAGADTLEAGTVAVLEAAAELAAVPQAAKAITITAQIARTENTFFILLDLLYLNQIF